MLSTETEDKQPIERKCDTISNKPEHGKYPLTMYLDSAHAASKRKWTIIGGWRANFGHHPESVSFRAKLHSADTTACTNQSMPSGSDDKMLSDAIPDGGDQSFWAPIPVARRPDQFGERADDSHQDRPFRPKIQASPPSQNSGTLRSRSRWQKVVVSLPTSCWLATPTSPLAIEDNERVNALSELRLSLITSRFDSDSPMPTVSEEAHSDKVSLPLSPGAHSDKVSMSLSDNMGSLVEDSGQRFDRYQLSSLSNLEVRDEETKKHKLDLPPFSTSQQYRIAPASSICHELPIDDGTITSAFLPSSQKLSHTENRTFVDTKLRTWTVTSSTLQPSAHRGAQGLLGEGNCKPTSLGDSVNVTHRCDKNLGQGDILCTTRSSAANGTASPSSRQSRRRQAPQSHHSVPGTDSDGLLCDNNASTLHRASKATGIKQRASTSLRSRHPQTTSSSNNAGGRVSERQVITTASKREEEPHNHIDTHRKSSAPRAKKPTHPIPEDGDRGLRIVRSQQVPKLDRSTSIVKRKVVGETKDDSFVSYKKEKIYGTTTTTCNPPSSPVSTDVPLIRSSISLHRHCSKTPLHRTATVTARTRPEGSGCNTRKVELSKSKDNNMLQQAVLAASKSKDNNMLPPAVLVDVSNSPDEAASYKSPEKQRRIQRSSRTEAPGSARGRLASHGSVGRSRSAGAILRSPRTTEHGPVILREGPKVYGNHDTRSKPRLTHRPMVNVSKPPKEDGMTINSKAKLARCPSETMNSSGKLSENLPQGKRAVVDNTLMDVPTSTSTVSRDGVGSEQQRIRRSSLLRKSPTKDAETPRSSLRCANIQEKSSVVATGLHKPQGCGNSAKSNSRSLAKCVRTSTGMDRKFTETDLSEEDTHIPTPAKKKPAIVVTWDHSTVRAPATEVVDVRVDPRPPRGGCRASGRILKPVWR
eukprot:Rmarinus@m.4179